MKTFETVLTPNLVKHQFYRKDEDFRKAIDSVRGYWVNSDRLKNRLWNSAALILRPDAIAGGQAAAVLPMLREHGFVPVVVRSVYVGSSRAEALWRYQFNVATPERQLLLKRVMSMGNAVYIIVHDKTIRLSAPATVHLTYLKGTAVIAKRKRKHLRTVAGPAVANVLSYVHVSDDPADVLREMAILFDDFTRNEIFAQLDAGVDRTDDVLRLIRRLESAAPKNALMGNGLVELDDRVSDNDRRLLLEWREIVNLSKSCQSFITGESYVGKDAIIPDDKELSLPLDAHLIFPEFGPR